MTFVLYQILFGYAGNFGLHYQKFTVFQNSKPSKPFGLEPPHQAIVGKAKGCQFPEPSSVGVLSDPHKLASVEITAGVHRVLCLQGALAEAVTGIYAGFASVGSSPTVHKMCMSIGWNPFYQNERKTIEPWILHKFDKDFYGKLLFRQRSSSLLRSVWREATDSQMPRNDIPCAV